MYPHFLIATSGRSLAVSTTGTTEDTRSRSKPEILRRLRCWFQIAEHTQNSLATIFNGNIAGGIGACTRIDRARFRSAVREFWKAEVHQHTAKALLEFVDKYSVLPTQPTLLTLVGEQAASDVKEACDKTVRELYDEDISDAPAVADRVVAFGKHWAMVNAVVEAAGYIDQGEPGKITKVIADALLVGEDILDIGAMMSDTSRRDTLYSDDAAMNVIPTGIYHLDQALGGGLERGELGMVIAPVHKGKTTTLVEIGYGGMRAGCGFKGVHYTLEMSQKKIERRYDDRLAWPFHGLKKTDVAKYITVLNERQRRFISGDMIVKRYPTGVLTNTMLRAHLRMLRAEGYVADYCLVDYPDLMKHESQSKDVLEQQKSIYYGLRNTAGEENVAMWGASQVGRGAFEKETITMQDVAGTIEKMGTADHAVALCQTLQEEIERRLRLFMAKVRGEESGGYVECVIDRARCRIQSVALYNAALDRIDSGESGGVVKGLPRAGASLKTQVGITRVLGKAAPKISKIIGKGR